MYIGLKVHSFTASFSFKVKYFELGVFTPHDIQATAWSFNLDENISHVVFQYYLTIVTSSLGKNFSLNIWLAREQGGSIENTTRTKSGLRLWGV